jgi:Mn-dependent DtxR family transcriptional regulator
LTRNKRNFRTYDEIVVDELREIEPATIKQIAKVLDNKNPQSLWHMLKRLCKEELIFVDITYRPFKYSVKRRVVSYESEDEEE